MLFQRDDLQAAEFVAWVSGRDRKKIAALSQNCLRDKGIINTFT